MVPKRNLGKRFYCHSCGAKFYDLNQPNASCPRCGADPLEAPSADPKLAAMAKFKAESAAARRSGVAIKEPLDIEEEELDPDTFEDDEDAADVTSDEDDDDAPEDMAEYDDDF